MINKRNVSPSSVLKSPASIPDQHSKNDEEKARATSTTTTTTTYRFATTVPNTIPHFVMKARKNWREIPVVFDEFGNAFAIRQNWDFFYADVGWIHQNLPYAKSSRLKSEQRVNHFANHSELTRKDLLAKNLQRASRAAKKRGENDVAEKFEKISPKTYSLPGDLSLFSREFDCNENMMNRKTSSFSSSSSSSSSNSTSSSSSSLTPPPMMTASSNIWIMKPIGQSQGRGIFFVWKRSQIQRWQNRRKKLDDDMNTTNSQQQFNGLSTSSLSSYSLQFHHQQQQQQQCEQYSGVSHSTQQQQNNNNNNNIASNANSINICKENYVAQKYIHNPLLIGGRKFDMRLYVLVISFSPLVVYVNREGFARFSSKRYDSKIKSNSMENYFVHLTNHSVQKKGESYDPNVCDLKWPLHKLRRHVRATFDNKIEETCFKEIENLIKLSCDAVKSSMIRDERCFELYGYDVMIDDAFKPWLIEVNASPSMTADSTSDKELKTRVFEDVLNALDFEKKFTERDDEHDGDDTEQKQKQQKRNQQNTYLARLPTRIGGFDAIVNESKDVCVQNLILKKKPTLGNSNTDREQNLKDIGVLSDEEEIKIK
jgi:tubulin polyglutamylase TTLL9